MNLKLTLDHAAIEIANGNGASAVDFLCNQLRQTLHEASVENWQQTILPLCKSHPIHQMLLQDPYTARAYLKPRGYAGDAEMLDYVYSGLAPNNTTSIGKAVFQGTVGGPNGRSVVNRRDMLAERIDQIAELTSRPRILSLACGHLRESNLSKAVVAGTVEEYIGVDQDSKSLDVAKRESSADCIKFINASVMDVVRGRIEFEGFDFAYAAGLFDYLPDELATRLLSKLFSTLNPGGWLLIGNFTPDNHGRGYMECFMDWRLLCRDETGLDALRDSIPPSELSAHRIFRDPDRNVVYLEMQRT